MKLKVTHLITKGIRIENKNMISYIFKVYLLPNRNKERNDSNLSKMKSCIRIYYATQIVFERCDIFHEILLMLTNIQSKY